jgi:hypothetical protein
MSKRASKMSDTEEFRQQLLADHGPNLDEQYSIGSFGCHELLDRTFLVANMVDNYVLTHPACVQNQEWFALAEQALDALMDLYQRIGVAQFDSK